MLLEKIEQQIIEQISNEIISSVGSDNVYYDEKFKELLDQWIEDIKKDDKLYKEFLEHISSSIAYSLNNIPSYELSDIIEKIFDKHWEFIMYRLITYFEENKSTNILSLIKNYLDGCWK